MSNDDIIKLNSTADILGGEVFFATENGADPENLDYNNLVPNGMYIRLNGSDGSLTYISAYELDKILDIVKDIPNKADKTDLELIQLLIEDKASNTDLELIQNEVDNKLSKAEFVESIGSINKKAEETNNTLSEKIDLKADKTELENLSLTVNKKAEKSIVDSLVSTVKTKADSDSVDSLMSDLNTLQETVKVLTDSDSICIINNQIAALTSELKKKLEYSDIKKTIDNVNEINSINANVEKRLDNIETKLNTKASNTFVQGEFTEIHSDLSNLSKTVNEKANKSDVALKVNKSDYDILVKKVNTINTNINKIDVNVTDKINTLTEQVDKKSDADYVESKVKDFTKAINSKLSVNDFIEKFDKISEDIDRIESTYHNKIEKNTGDIEILDCELNNHITEFHSNIKTQNAKHDLQDKKIAELKEYTEKQAEQLKQTWVRTLSSNEYKRLLDAPSGSTYNPKYKYPNTVYLVVDFNVPKAIYIGDILIAKAKKDGSMGFAYEFPIIF